MDKDFAERQITLENLILKSHALTIVANLA